MTTALFIHHSIGRQIIAAGLRDDLASAPEVVQLWDHDYNDIGLTDWTGRRTGVPFPIPGDDTDPLGLVTLLEALANRAIEVPDHDLLILKSCFPNNGLADDAAASAMKGTYSKLRGLADDLPAYVLLLSSPPLATESTRFSETKRATEMAQWLHMTWPGPGLGFGDLYGALSYRSGPLRGTLKASYRARRPRDSHLSAAGARAGASLVVEAIHHALAEMASARTSAPGERRLTSRTDSPTSARSIDAEG